MPMKAILKRFSLIKLLPLIVAIVFVGLLFRKILINELYPYPGNLLVSFYFPWQNGGWKGYDPFVFHKEFIASDAIRQDIPWRFLAISQLKQGQIPLWNPYSFSGTPLLANLQSAVFYPLNVIFFVMPFFEGWILYIVLAPLLGLVYTYLFLRRLKISRPASLFGGVSFVTSTFFLVWLEIGIVAHTVIWLPLLLWSVEKFQQKHQYRYVILAIIISVCLILAGHFQTGLHVLLVSGVYWLWSIFKSKQQWHIGSLWPVVLWAIASVVLVAFQLLPTYELKQLSPLTESFAKDVYQDIQTPWLNLTTLFVPDYLGNPAFENFVTDIYGDGTPFVSVVAVVFAIAAVRYKQDWRVKFWLVLFLIYLFFGFPGPIYHLVGFLQIDLLTGTLASRSLVIVVFALTVLSSYGLDSIINLSQKRKFKPIFSLAVLQLLILGGLILWAVFEVMLDKSWVFTSDQARFAIKSSLLPVSISIVVFGGLGLLAWQKQLKLVVGLGIFLITTIYGLYQANRILPFSPQKYFYPQHPVINQMQQASQLGRVAGIQPTVFEKSFYPMYGLYSPEGYDSLRIKRYAELFAGQFDGNLADIYSKSDADFIAEGTFGRSRLLNLTSVSHVFDKNEADINKLNTEPYKYPHDTVDLIWVLGKFRIYERLDALPRVKLYSEYEVISDKEQLLSRVYDENLDISKTLLLEEEIDIKPTPLTQKSVSIGKITANQVQIDTRTDADSLLLLTDADFPGWKAYIDGQPTRIYRANYAFRSIQLPQGEHSVIFRYEPDSFLLGVGISSLGGLALLALTWVGTITKKIVW